MFNKQVQFILGLIVFLSACASKPLSTEHKNEINKVAAVSLFNDKLRVVYLGLTVFNNQNESIDIGSWHLNEEISKTLEAGLKSIGKSFQKTSFDQTKITAAIDSGNTAIKKLFGDKNADLNDYLVSTTKEQGANYLFVFQPHEYSNYPHPKGFGLFCRALLGSDGVLEAYGFFYVTLWDVNKKQKIFDVLLKPDTLTESLGKNCEELKKTAPEKFVEKYKKNLQALAKKSAEMVLGQSGLTTMSQ